MVDLSVGVRRWPLISAALALVGLADSIYLWSSKLGAPLICGVGSCDVVNASPYSALFGVPVAAFGAVGYAVLLALALWAARDAWRASAPEWLIDVRLLVAFGGVVFSAYLTAIEVFVLHAI
jgi:uncharacterized membrane protein